MRAVYDEATLDRFSGLPTGPPLAAVLETLDPTTLDGQDTAAWMRAAFRVRNHADWLLLRSIREACSARADTTARVDLDEFAPKIAAASLGWSATMAATRLELAVGVLERMPALGEAMRVGRLEHAKAAAFVTGLDGLTDPQCRAVVAALLDQAPELTLAQLRERILDTAYAIDHVWAANRLAAATARARVATETAPSGAVNICGRDLPPELALQAKHRLRALALAVRARLRAAGRRVALGFIEARLFVRLMDGTHAGADDTQVIDAVTTELLNPTQPTPDDPDDPDDGGPDGEGPDGPGPDDPGPDSPDGPDGGGSDGPDASGPGDDEPGDEEPGDETRRRGPATSPATRPRRTRPRRPRARRRTSPRASTRDPTTAVRRRGSGDGGPDDGGLGDGGLGDGRSWRQWPRCR